MNDLILTKMREGDWGAVVRLMREEREGVSLPAQLTSCCSINTLGGTDLSRRFLI